MTHVKPAIGANCHTGVAAAIPNWQIDRAIRGDVDMTMYTAANARAIGCRSGAVVGQGAWSIIRTETVATLAGGGAPEKFGHSSRRPGPG